MINRRKLLKRREEILREISGLKEMRRGCLIAQYYSGKEPGKVLGPYPLYTFKRDGKTISRRIRDREDLKLLRSQVENYHRFKALCRELVEIGEGLCELREKERE